MFHIKLSHKVSYFLKAFETCRNFPTRSGKRRAHALEPGTEEQPPFLRHTKVKNLLIAKQFRELLQIPAETNSEVPTDVSPKRMLIPLTEIENMKCKMKLVTNSLSSPSINFRQYHYLSSAGRVSHIDGQDDDGKETKDKISSKLNSDDDFVPSKEYLKRVESFSEMTFGRSSSPPLSIDELLMIFIHHSLTKKPELRSLRENHFDRLSQVGESIIDFTLTNYLLFQHQLDVKVKQVLLDTSIDGTLRKISDHLGITDLIQIDPSYLKHEILLFSIKSLFVLIGMLYLKCGMPTAQRFLSKHILVAVFLGTERKEIDYLQELEELVAKKFNTIPRYVEQTKKGRSIYCCFVFI